MDLYDLLVWLGVIKRSTYIDEGRLISEKTFDKVLKQTLISKLTVKDKKTIIREKDVSQVHEPIKRLYVMEKILRQCEESAHE